MKKHLTKLIDRASHPLLLSPEERLAIWRAARGMWKNRKPDPIKELKKMRREWERKLPWSVLNK